MKTCDGLADVDAVVLAGGRGTRLGSVPGNAPKPLRPVRGRPFLSYLLDQLEAAGGRRVILALAHRPEAFRDFLASRPGSGLSVETSLEASPAGTGGALRAALPLVRSGTVLVMNGDTYARVDLGRLVGAHRRRGAAATLLLARVPDASRFGTVEVDARGAVTRFAEKGASGPGWVNSGVYVLERRVIEGVPGGRPVSLEEETLPSLIGRGFFGEPGASAFLDIGTPESYREAEDFFQKPGDSR